MRRGFFAPVKAFWLAGRRMVAAFVHQRVTLALLVAVALFVLSLVFAFLAAAPVLSPFVYPMF